MHLYIFCRLKKFFACTLTKHSARAGCPFTSIDVHEKLINPAYAHALGIIQHACVHKIKTDSLTKAVLNIKFSVYFHFSSVFGPKFTEFSRIFSFINPRISHSQKQLQIDKNYHKTAKNIRKLRI